jgi:protoheme IX farnesyltransferase
MEQIGWITGKKSSINNYIQITKPGIVLGNLVSVAGGFFLATKGAVNWILFLDAALGVCLIVASGCVFNNIIDRDIDRLMTRTRSRALANESISINSSFFYASALGFIGLLLLHLKTNIVAVAVALVGFIIYVGLYSLHLKRNSVHGTLVGSIAGAAPPVIGYCAVSQQFDSGAALLLLLFSLWQMPHAFAIAIFRLKDYRAAAIPVLPVKRGIKTTKYQILFFTLAFILTNTSLTFTGYTGPWYLTITSMVGCYWLYIAWSGFTAKDDEKWARKIFSFSIVTVVTLSIMMSIDGVD